MLKHPAKHDCKVPDARTSKFHMSFHCFPNLPQDWLQSTGAPWKSKEGRYYVVKCVTEHPRGSKQTKANINSWRASKAASSLPCPTNTAEIRRGRARTEREHRLACNARLSSSPAGTPISPQEPSQGGCKGNENQAP